MPEPIFCPPGNVKSEQTAQLAHTVAPQFLRLNQVVEITGLSRARIYALAACGKFPKPLKISSRASAWEAASVATWQAARIAARDIQSEGSSDA